MADSTLTNLTAAGAAAGADLLYTVQGGNSRKQTVTALQTFILASPTLTGTTTLPGSGSIDSSGDLTIGSNGAASVSPLLLSGTILTGGTGTTNFPALFVQPTGTTAATTWSTSGTGLGMNLASGFAGNFLDFRVNGGSSLFSVNSTGALTAPNLTATSSVAAGAGGFFGWTGRSLIFSPSNGTITINNNAQTSLVTLSVPTTASLQMGAADVDTNASIVAQTLRTQGALAGGTADQAGKDFTIIVSPGKGTGAGGKFVVQTTPAGSTGTTVGTATTALTINSAQQSIFAAGTVSAPSISVGDTGTGFYKGATNQIWGSVNGSAVSVLFSSGWQIGNAQMLAGTSSATAPVFVPTTGSTTTGIGGTSGNISMVVSGAEAARFAANKNVVLNSAAIATNATDGFLYIATCAGTPTGVPTAFTGRVALVYDTTNHQFWIYDGAWLQPKTPAAAALVTWQ